ncbi:MAG: T9SS C-terminal target domain-containing protein [Bacteroidetes bacterium]|nr:MAG: T9SS C-terminal target domain-containing protein [Bacteroidota bacterium]
MKPIIALLFFITGFNCIKAQTTLVAKWPNSGSLTGKQLPLFNDTSISLVTSGKIFTYNKNTQTTSSKDLLRPDFYINNFVNNKTNVNDGFYFTTNKTIGAYDYDTLYYFEYASLKCFNTGVVNISKQADVIRFVLQVEAEQNAIYVMAGDINGKYHVYKVTGALAQNQNIKLDYPISNWFKASNDTFVYLLRYTFKPPIGSQSFRNTEVHCKVGNRYNILYKQNSDSFVVSEITIFNQKAYFKVNSTQNYSKKQQYRSHFKTLDAEPSNDVLTSYQFSGERVAPGIVRVLNFNQRSVDRIDWQSGVTIKTTPITDNFFELTINRTIAIRDNIWISSSQQYGTEFCMITAEDSLVRLDILPGMHGTFDDQYSTSYFEPLITGDTAWAIVRNFVDHNNYIYAMTGNYSKPFWPVAMHSHDSFDLGSITFFKQGNNLYWFDYTTNDMLLYSISITETTTVPKLMPSIGGDEWHIQLGFGAPAKEYPQLNTGGIQLDDFGNVILSAHSIAEASWLPETSILAYEENKSVKLKAGQFTAKLNNKGQLLWVSSFGNTRDYISRHLNQVVDSKGDIYVAGQARGVIIFANDTIISNNEALNYLVKLDGNTGDILWYKQLFYARDYDRNTIESMVIDDQDNLYLAIQYTDRGIRILNQYLSNNRVSPANALIKLNASGNLVWAKNMITPFTTYFGKTRAMVVDTENEKIYTVQSVGYYNWRSSCKYNTWYTYVQCIHTKTGEQFWDKQIISDDLHSNTSIILTKQKDILLGGFFRGTITLGKFKFTSLADKDCNQYQHYFTLLNNRSGDVYFASTKTTESFFPYQLCSNKKKDIYAIGALKRKKNSYGYDLAVWQVNDYGDVVAERKFVKRGDPFDFDFFPTIAANNNYLVFSDVVYGSKLDTFNNCFMYGEQLSVVKLKLNALTKTSPFAGDSKVKLTDYQIALFPNPFKDNIMVTVEQANEINLLKVVDINGKVVKTMPLNKDWYYHNINLSDLVQGVYFLQFSGAKGNQFIKAIKSE